MMTTNETWAHLMAAPRDFLHGLLGGLFGPILALIGAIGLLYVLTHKLPAIKHVARADGTRQPALVLASQPEARASWARFRGDLRGAMLDVKARSRAASEAR